MTRLRPTVKELFVLSEAQLPMSFYAVLGFQIQWSPRCLSTQMLWNFVTILLATVIIPKIAENICIGHRLKIDGRKNRREAFHSELANRLKFKASSRMIWKTCYFVGEFLQIRVRIWVGIFYPENGGCSRKALTSCKNWNQVTWHKNVCWVRSPSSEG